MKRAAHVGMTKSDDDRWRVLAVHGWLCLNTEIDLYDYAPDIIDLHAGRDFLKEDKQYDIVILHYIFNGKPCVGAHFPQMPDMKVSALNDWYNWCQRLEKCGAKYIFAFGQESEVSGRYLVSISGYGKPIQDDSCNNLAIFIKQ